jgi:hypothetical protein
MDSQANEHVQQTKPKGSLTFQNVATRLNGLGPVADKG